jgi:hypothetical protein
MAPALVLFYIFYFGLLFRVAIFSNQTYKFGYIMELLKWKMLVNFQAIWNI